MTFRPQPLSPFASTRHYFGSELRRHRERANLSLVQLADIVNSSKSTLARIETAELMPPPDIPAAWTSPSGRISTSRASTNSPSRTSIPTSTSGT